MKWDKGRTKEIIESNIDCWSEEIEFGRVLLTTLQRTTTEASFIRAAKREAKGHSNPWIRDELYALIVGLE
jgi:hypothetical protein